MSSHAHVRILGVPVHDITLDGAVDLVAEGARSGRMHQIATVNPEFVMKARRNAEFMRVLNSTALSVPDGVGILYAARLLGSRLSERVTGVDLMEKVAALAATTGLRLYLLGAAPGVADTAAQRLCERHPGLQIAGTYAGSPRPEEEEEIANRIRRAHTDVLFVAYGAPAQDLWIARNGARTGAGVAVGVGGSFDFIAGVSRRAPRWAQSLGLEWLYRLAQEPWRWKRMLALPRFAAAVLAQRLTGRATGSRSPHAANITPSGDA